MCECFNCCLQNILPRGFGSSLPSATSPLGEFLFHFVIVDIVCTFYSDDFSISNQAPPPPPQIKLECDSTEGDPIAEIIAICEELETLDPISPLN